MRGQADIRLPSFSLKLGYSGKLSHTLGLTDEMLQVTLIM